MKRSVVTPPAINVNQAEILQVIKEEGPIPVESKKYHGNVMNKLHNSGLLRMPRYLNGEFWELTSTGVLALNNWFNNPQA